MWMAKLTKGETLEEIEDGVHSVVLTPRAWGELWKTSEGWAAWVREWKPRELGKKGSRFSMRKQMAWELA